MDKNAAKIWYLAGPFFRYEQDVKELAKKAGVRIVDANVTESRKNAADAKDLPKVTLKPEYRPAKGKEKPLTKEEQDAIDAANALMAGGQQQPQQ